MRTIAAASAKKTSVVSKLYAWWCLVVLVSLFFVVLIPSIIGTLHKRLHVIALAAYKVWGTFLFWLSFLPVRVIGRQHLPKHTPYILTPNHTSYLDVPLMVHAIPDLFVFVGKSSLNKIPLFGYIFRRVHIPVNRANPKSGLKALQEAKERLQSGRSVLLFPEGGFGRVKPPTLAPFKEGAFRLAIETGCPIVPVTLPYNWKILPDRKDWRIFRQTALVVIHPPIYTHGLTLNDVEALKEKTYSIIADELSYYHPQATIRYENHARNVG